MRENRPSGLEGGARFHPSFLPLSQFGKGNRWLPHLEKLVLGGDWPSPLRRRAQDSPYSTRTTRKKRSSEARATDLPVENPWAITLPATSIQPVPRPTSRYCTW